MEMYHVQVEDTGSLSGKLFFLHKRCPFKEVSFALMQVLYIRAVRDYKIYENFGCPKVFVAINFLVR